MYVCYLGNVSISENTEHIFLGMYCKPKNNVLCLQRLASQKQTLKTYLESAWDPKINFPRTFWGPQC